MNRFLLAPLAFAFAACQPDAPVDPTPAAPVETMTEAEAPEVSPPDSIASAFTDAYPTATDIEWEMEDDGYAVSFKMDGQEMSIVYAADGTAGAVETEIPVASLPGAVTDALARDYADAEVTEAARIVENGQTTYEAEISRGGRAEDVMFQEDGTFIEIVAAETEDPDDDDDFEDND